MITPRYSVLFINRFCPRSCSYCLSRKVKGDGKLLSPEQWAEALAILESEGVNFHLILGNELFSYPDPVGFVKALAPFWGRYAVYSTFPRAWTDRHLEKCLQAGLYNISGGVDVWPGLKTGDNQVDRKSNEVLYWLEYCLKRGIPDVQATVTIHRHNYDKLFPLLDLCTEKGIWVGASMVEYSVDGKHDFYGDKASMMDWIIPDDERGKFRDEMYKVAEQVRTGRWKMQLQPSYFEECADRELSQTPWHCSQPLLIAVEEDGSLRACGYRGPLGQKWSVFEFTAETGRLTMERYVQLQQEQTAKCPGCGGGGGAWSYWWLAEHFQKGDVALGDKVLQTHVPGYEFDKTVKP